ncbi:hypothetical protein EJV47_24010 [Hymenobacter gummosus]|uniref:Lipid A biosynthesis acyltransferase n=1 Tax=Hymenobacter gummosus TaxID=1776032 RepID=A0A431TX11_9BACT|nr:hypothetical protein [Hymenobacter gummosus]RTQ45897.1 hypothetical protein EJV47_24010 [Hymenobacter gummosus]
MTTATLSAPSADLLLDPAEPQTPREAYLARVAEVQTRSRERSAAAHRQAPHGTPTHNFLLCAANRHHYLPEHPATEAEFFAEVMAHRDWAALDEQEAQVFGLTRFTGDTSFLADVHSRPRVFCTFHLGSYRMIHHFLLRHGIHYTLVVDQVTLEQQGDKFQALRQSNPVYHGGSMRILNAESPSIGLQMIREIKAGRSLLFYIDGNTGVGGMDRQDDKLTRINFLSRQIYARKGIAFISHVTRTPIVPLLHLRHGAADYETHFFAPIEPTESELPREEFAAATTQHIFGLFEPVLRRHPEQWEGWLYMNHFVDQNALREAHPPRPVPATAPGPLSFNQARYRVFWHADTPQLFDQATYQTFAISDKLAALLPQLAALPAEVQQRFSATPLFQDLWARQVVVAAGE